MAKAKESPAVPVEPVFAAAVPPDGAGRPTAPEGTQPPPFGTPKLADAKGEFPRVCQQLERVPAGSGLVRYKIRARNYNGFNEPLYILAKAGDKEGAKAAYLEASGINAHLAGLKESGVKETEPVLFHAVELDD